jgi:predicted cupin superfamily sugar epimerase
LKAGERSHWHRVDAAEVWQWYAGDALELSLSPDGKAVQTHALGPAFANGERPQIVVPKNVWQSARPLGAYALVGCTVAPAFAFDGFEMAPPDWRPG